MKPAFLSLFLFFALGASAQIEEDYYEESGVEIPPEFPGGMQQLKAFIDSNLVYPDSAAVKRKQGTVVVQFTVREDGSLSEFKIVKDIGFGCGEEVIRMMKTMPKWKPGTRNGEVTTMRMNLPVHFELDKNGKKKKQR